MLKGGNPLTVGVGIIIEVIRKNNSDYDPENLTGIEQPPSGRDPIYLGALLRLFAAHVPDFMNLVMNQNERVQNADGTWTEKKRELRAAYGGVIEPLGFNRFKTCELMAELLHCSNMALLNEKGSDRYVKERDKERERLKALREKTREGQKEASYSQDLGGFRFMGVMGEKGPLEVQNGDDNSSDGTTEDDGFEDVSAEGLLMEEIRPLKTPSKTDTEDEDVDLLLEDEPIARRDINAGDAEDVFFKEPSSSTSAGGPSSTEKSQTPPVPIVEVTNPAGDPVPSASIVQPKPVAENVREGLERINLQEQVKNKDLPPLPAQTETEVQDIEKPETAPEAKPDSPKDILSGAKSSDDKSETAGEGTNKQPEKITPEQVIPQSRTPPPPYAEIEPASLSTATGSEEKSSASPNSPATQNIASAERRNAELPPLPTYAQNDTQAQSTTQSSSTVDTESPPEVSPFSDPADAEAEPGSNAPTTTATTLSSVPTFREYAAIIEPDYDGNPVVGDYLKMQFVEHRVVVTILDFFFRFPWNNFLHNVVYDVVQQVFNGPMDRGYNRTLAIDLFVTGRITERIIEGQRASDRTQRETRMRMGYMGHLTLIAEEVVKFTEKYFNPPDILSQIVLEKVMHPDWIDYVENVLTETRERDNAILGGFRPDQSLGPRSAAFGSMGGQGLGGLGGLGSIGGGGGGGSGVSGGLTTSDLDTIDLANGTGGVGSSGTGSFSGEGSTATTGTSGAGLLSGFGSSSDEDEDEIDRDDEDEEMGGVGGGRGMGMGIGGSSGGGTGGTGANDQVGDLLFDDDIDPETVDEDLLAKYRSSFEDMDRF